MVPPRPASVETASQIGFSLLNSTQITFNTVIHPRVVINITQNLAETHYHRTVNKTWIIQQNQTAMGLPINCTGQLTLLWQLLLSGSAPY